MTKTPRRHAATRALQAGFGLVELMVAVTIGLFVVTGVGVVFLNFRQAFSTQDALAQLQDNERLALTLLGSTIESAGYFPNPVLNTATTLLPAASGSYGTLAAGQAVVGTSAAAGDTITTRFATSSGDGLLNCLGQTNTSGGTQVFMNTFSLAASGDLLCSTDGGTTTNPIVGNVSSFSVLYGVDTNGLGTAYSYLPASAVTAAQWRLVRTARIAIAFKNPFAGQSGQPPTVSWTQIISLLNKS
ncbi:MAG: PilW family protein [Burkholderiales bacterium]|nr:PilW family protein [Burkholderiales bacterium]MDE2276780.1 PilW family protein [Burkholderiales bacterium]